MIWNKVTAIDNIPAVPDVTAKTDEMWEYSTVGVANVMMTETCKFKFGDVVHVTLALNCKA